jgi:hypothetical protein
VDGAEAELGVRVAGSGKTMSRPVGTGPDPDAPAWPPWAPPVGLLASGVAAPGEAEAEGERVNSGVPPSPGSAE